MNWTHKFASHWHRDSHESKEKGYEAKRRGCRHMLRGISTFKGGLIGQGGMKVRGKPQTCLAMGDTDRRECSAVGKAAEKISTQEWLLSVGFSNRDFINKLGTSQLA